MRLNRRAVKIGAGMAAQPSASLPQQMGDPAALRAAYRLMGHPRIEMQALLKPHCDQTKQAAAAQPVVLWVEDTTELDYTAHPATRGLGPIGDGRGRGMLLHSTLAIVPDTRQVVGVGQAEVVLRQARQGNRKAHWTRTPESRVWERSAQAIGSSPSGSLWVHVSDRASDLFEYLAACVDLDKHFLVRAFHNRRLHSHSPAPPADAQKMLDYARQLPEQPNSAFSLDLPARTPRPARQAQLALTWAVVSLPPPAQAPVDIRHHAALRVWVVRAWEPNPPPGVDALEWLLLTSLPVTTLTEAHRLLTWYTCRWLCEDFHQCLKTGCQIERSQFDDRAELQTLLGFAAPIAVRLLQLRQLARQTPDVLAHQVVDPLLVQVLARLVSQPVSTLTLETFWQRVARLGGHQGRRRDGPPGWRTLWRGWQYLSDLATGAQLFLNLDLA